MSFRASLKKLIRRDPADALRDRAADLRASLPVPETVADATVSEPSEPETVADATVSEPSEPADGIDVFTQLEFSAYELDDPVKTPQEWLGRFAAHSMSMHVADRTLRMSKPEMIAFIRDAGERDAELPGIMFQALDSAQSTMEGWGELLSVARSRYIVAASAEQVETEAVSLEVEAPVEPAAAQSFADQVVQAGADHDVLAGGGIDHRDGTVSYCDASGKVSRRPLAHWISFTAQQMHNRVQHEMGRRRVAEANHLAGDEHAGWEARVRRELRSDAVHALAFRHDRAFGAAQALRTGAEPATQALREQGDAELLALAPLWEAAVDLYQQQTDEENAISEAASDDGWPGPAPDGAGPAWRVWFAQKEVWRERTGVAAAEEASGEAGTALYKIEVQIGDLPAASLAGLKLKARVAQRSDDIGVSWPDNLGVGLARDVLAFTEARARLAAPDGPNLVGLLDLASATMDDLQTIRDLADRVGSVAYAHAWGVRCHEGTNAHGASVFNDAGKLVMWLGDALTDVESAVDKEVARRAPVDSSERETRLSMLAVTTIDNGDPDEIEAFARELLAHAEAERRGR